MRVAKLLHDAWLYESTGTMWLCIVRRIRRRSSQLLNGQHALMNTLELACTWMDFILCCYSGEQNFTWKWTVIICSKYTVVKSYGLCWTGGRHTLAGYIYKRTKLNWFHFVEIWSNLAYESHWFYCRTSRRVMIWTCLAVVVVTYWVMHGQLLV